MAKELFRLTIYEDINKLSEMNIEGKKFQTRDTNEMFEAIRTMLLTRLDRNHQKIMKDMKKKGAIK